jgi:hypothetical protein
VQIALENDRAVHATGAQLEAGQPYQGDRLYGHRLPGPQAILTSRCRRKAPKEPGFIFATALGCLATPSGAESFVLLWQPLSFGSCQSISSVCVQAGHTFFGMCKG